MCIDSHCFRETRPLLSGLFYMWLSVIGENRLCVIQCFFAENNFAYIFRLSNFLCSLCNLAESSFTNTPNFHRSTGLETCCKLGLGLVPSDCYSTPNELVVVLKDRSVVLFIPVTLIKFCSTFLVTTFGTVARIWMSLFASHAFFVRQFISALTMIVYPIISAGDVL